MSAQPAVGQISVPKTDAEQILERNKDKSNWEWVEVPEEDLYGKPFGFISINFRKFPSGKHFVDPETAGEMKRLLHNRFQGDVRVMQPGQDKRAVEFMVQTGPKL